MSEPPTKQNAVVESAIWRVMKAGMAARREITRLFPALDLAKIPPIGAGGNRLRIESGAGAAECLNHCATTANPGPLSPFEVFTGRESKLNIGSFFSRV